MVLGIEQPTAGEVSYRGRPLSSYGKKQWKSFREEVQAVFQNPLDSFDPRFSVGQLLDEPLSINTKLKRDERKKKAAELLEMVGLSAEFTDRYPHEFSGGQLQRIAIARALALEPKLLVLDEPVSALDVSVRGQILNLLHDLQKDKKISYLYISHDIASVRYLCDSIAIIYFGQIVEYGSTEQIFENPLHPYTQELLRAGVVTKLTDDVQGPAAGQRNLWNIRKTARVIILCAEDWIPPNGYDKLKDRAPFILQIKGAYCIIFA